MKEEKHIADLRAGFGSLKFLPQPMVLSHNSLNPKLILHSDHIEYRGGFLTNRAKYEGIGKVDVYFRRRKTKNIVFYLSPGITTFIANFINRKQLQEFLSILHDKGCPLTDRAKEEMRKL